MDLSRALPDEVILEVFDEEWVQTVDYEHIPFRCHRCHEHGHLFRDCPLSKIENKSKATTVKDTENFHKVGYRGKGGKRGPKKHQTEGQQANLNRFQVLEEEEEKTKVDQVMEGSLGEKEKEENSEQTQDIHKKKEIMLRNRELEIDQEMTQSEMEMEDHELQDILDREHLDLEGFLKQGTMVGVDSLLQEEFNRVQQLFLWKSWAKGMEMQRNNERQGNEGVKTMKTTPGLAPRNVGKKRVRKKQNELLMECGNLMIDSSKMKDLTNYSFTNLS